MEQKMKRWKNSETKSKLIARVERSFIAAFRGSIKLKEKSENQPQKVLLHRTHKKDTEKFR